MKVVVFAVGRLGRIAEAELSQDYIRRASLTGRALGLGPVELVEIDARRPGKLAEGETVLAALEAGGRSGLHIIACDEHGRASSSRQFAERIGRLRDDGVRRLALLIGAADGLSQSVLDQADETLAFGPQTWPHALARVMLTEQLYRATTLLSGGPYHRD